MWYQIVLFLFLIFNLLYERAGAEPSFLCAGFPHRETDRALAKVARPTTGKDHPVVIFAAFRGTFPEGTPAPEYARSIFNPNVEGSFSHFYGEMSFGALTIEGAWLPKIYLSKKEIESYEGGGYGLFNQEILKAADAEIDFSQYDNDGPDGKPNSGDDDGNVDFVFIDILGEIPRDFINASATGTASLGLSQAFVTDDPRRSFGKISIQDGTTQRVLGFHHAVGSMAHEYGHTLGLPDLYNASFINDPRQSPEDDFAGIGAWGLMGYGAQGWNGDDGPNPFSPWERELLGWIGMKNDRLVTVTGRLSHVAIDDLTTGGVIYKLPVNDQEYFLVENRQASGSYYNRNIPQSGLLIWHINPHGSQGDETRKMVDLECADGLFADKGYSDGRIPDMVTGRDNLDFWAHDTTYSKAHAGNTGDATDIFDGEWYTAFNWGTNPNSNSYDPTEDYTFGTGRQNLFSPISVANIKRQGSTMLADINVAWSGSITGKGVWQGKVYVSGDLTIEPGAELAIIPGTVVDVDASDDQSGGLDPSQIEIIVAGILKTSPGQSGAMTSFTPKGRWSGIQLLGRSARVELKDVRIEGAVDGISGSDIGRLRLTSFTIRGSSQNGIHLSGMNSTVELQDGTIEDNKGRGMWIDGGGRVDVRRVLLRGNTGTGITAAGVYLRLEGGSLRENGSGGIRAEQGTLIVQGSRIIGNDGGGISVEDAHVECRGNLFERNGEGYALELTGITGGVIQQNRFTPGHGLGVRIVSSLLSPGLLTIDNLFEDGDAGLSTLSSNPVLSGNTFQGNRIALLAEGEGVPVLMFNTFINNEWAVRNMTSQTISAANNWWGMDKAAEIGTRISGPVNWHPFLIAPPKDSRGIILRPGFPNPFNHTITFLYQSSYQQSISIVLSIYDTAGQLVRVLVNEMVQPGRHNAIWDGRDERGREVANGMYICKIVASLSLPANGAENLLSKDSMISRIMVVR